MTSSTRTPPDLAIGQTNQEPRGDVVATFAHRFSRSRSGGIAVVFSLALVPLLGCVALAVDVSTWYSARTEMQKIADGAAIAAARELRVGFASPSQVEAAARAYAQAALHYGAKSARDATIVAQVSADRDAVRVSVASSLSPVFSRIVYSGLANVEVSSTARLSGSAPICMIGTRPRGRGVLKMEDTSYLDAGGCGIYANSTHRHSLYLKDSSVVMASLICSAGGVRLRGGRASPTPQTDCPSVGDPLAPRIEAVKATLGQPCGDSDGILRITGNTTLNPGNYCGGIEIVNGATVRFQSGNYIIGGDGLTVKDNGSIMGEYVSMLFVNGAAFDLKQDSSIRLSANRDGVLAGILFMQYPYAGAADDDDDDDVHANININIDVKAKGRFRISSNDARELLGTIYIPYGRFQVDAERPVAGESAYTVIVANRVEISDKARLTLNIDYAATDVPVPEGIGPNSPVNIAY